MEKLRFPEPLAWDEIDPSENMWELQSDLCEHLKELAEKYNLSHLVTALVNYESALDEGLFLDFVGALYEVNAYAERGKFHYSSGVNNLTEAPRRLYGIIHDAKENGHPPPAEFGSLLFDAVELFRHAAIAADATGRAYMAALAGKSDTLAELEKCQEGLRRAADELDSVLRDSRNSYMWDFEK